MALPLLMQGGFKGVGWHRSVIRLSKPIPYETFVSSVLPALEQTASVDGENGSMWGVFVHGQRDASGEVVPFGAAPAILSPSAEVEQQIANGQTTAYFWPGKFAYYYSAPHGGVVALWVYIYNADPLAVSQDSCLLTEDGGMAFLDAQAAASLDAASSESSPSASWYDQGALTQAAYGETTFEGYSLGAAPTPVAPLSISDRTISALDWIGKQVNLSTGSSLRTWATENPGKWQAVYVTGSLLVAAGAVAAGTVVVGALGAKLLGTAIGAAKIFPWAVTLLRATAFAGVVMSLNMEAVSSFSEGYSTLQPGTGVGSSSAQLWRNLGVSAREGKEKADNFVRTVGETIESVKKRFAQASQALSAIGIWGALLFGGLLFVGYGLLARKR